MGLETATYISGLVATNPVGATDPKSQGDDHLRLIKSTLLATFAAIAGAVTASHTELNLLTGATGLTGTGNTVRSASPTFTGTLTAATVAATTITGAGSGITALNASNLASGTVPDARFPATLPAASAANLTAIPAANLSGSIADARLSANVPLLNAANVFTANQTMTLANARLHINSSSGAAASLAFDNNGTSKSYVGISLGSSQIITGDAANDTVIRNEGGNILFSANSGTSAHLKIASTGAITTPNATAAECGYKGMPLTVLANNYTFALADAGCYFGMNATSKAFAIDETSVTFPIGTVLGMEAYGTGTTITFTSTTGYLAGTAYGTTGTRNLAQGGIAFAIKRAAASWIIFGPGVS